MRAAREMICKAPAVGGLAVQAVAGRAGVCGIPGAQMRGHSTPRTKTCPWGPGPGAPILEGLRSVPPATRLTWTWRSTRQPVWRPALLYRAGDRRYSIMQDRPALPIVQMRPALLYRAGDRRYLIVQETGATLSCRRAALPYRAGDRRYLIVQESGATLSCRRPALPYRAGERRYLIVQETGATLSCRRAALPYRAGYSALPYRAGYRRYLIVQDTGATLSCRRPALPLSGRMWMWTPGELWGSRSPTHLQKARMGHLGETWISPAPNSQGTPPHGQRPVRGDPGTWGPASSLVHRFPMSQNRDLGHHKLQG